MDTRKYTIKVNLPGGILSVGDLAEILNAAENAGAETVRLGNRQQLYFEIHEDRLEDLEYNFFISDIEFEAGTDNFPNILSSYATEEIFDNSGWMREGVYKDILDTFDYKPELKINLVNNTQTLAPFFTGNLNFISSDTSNYWHLYVRFPGTNIIHCWSTLIYSEDIAQLSRQIENFIAAKTGPLYNQSHTDGNLLEARVRQAMTFFIQPVLSPLKLPDFQLPYYEGFNKYNNDRYWLGIYRRNELFSIAFLKDICTICKKTRIGQICTTPWKSIIIKGVKPADRKLWNLILGKHRINVRHASNELNWQIEDLCEYALKLKHELISKFDQADLRTYKLCFAIKTSPKTGLFGSVIIRKRSENSGDRFDILHTLDFNPNSKNFITYKQNISRELLSDALAELCNQYYQQTSTEAGPVINYYENGPVPVLNEVILYQCSYCLSIYDEEYGDDINGIAPKTPFTDLDDTYRCPTCEAAKKDFKAIKKRSLTHL